MSYPRQLQTLIIEDDPGSKTLYDELLTDIRRRDPSVLWPRYAFSYQDAVAELSQERPFHLVVLDLCLPERAGRPPSLGVDLGMRLLDLCEKRDRYPIIGLMIVTGNANRTEQTLLRDRLHNSFSYGQLIVKGGDSLQVEIERALSGIRSYSDIGIHIKDTLSERWPVLSPRDEDLLRRAALAKEASGYDLRWWSAEYSKPTGQHAAFQGWTKVLMGHFLLSDGRGSSRPMFCKLMPRGEFEVVAKDAQVLEQKLSHIKVKATAVGGARSLLITEKTGDSSTPPIALDVFLSKPAAEVSTAVATIASDVLVQTEALGDSRADMIRLEDLFWKHHNADRLNDLSRKHPPPKVSPKIKSLCIDPLSLLQYIKDDRRSFRVELRDCLHGDLNVTNIAVDYGRQTRGYIFDASGVGSGPAMRDLAMLEISTLLHVPAGIDKPMVLACSKFLYGNSFLPSPFDYKSGSDRAVNTLTLIRELRTYAHNKNYYEQYAFCLFDQALIQVGGLAWPSGNKVRNFGEAVLLASLIAGWIERTMPHLIDTVSTAASAGES